MKLGYLDHTLGVDVKRRAENKDLDDITFIINRKLNEDGTLGRINILVEFYGKKGYFIVHAYDLGGLDGLKISFVIKVNDHKNHSWHSSDWPEYINNWMKEAQAIWTSIDFKADLQRAKEDASNKIFRWSEAIRGE